MTCPFETEFLYDFVLAGRDTERTFYTLDELLDFLHAEAQTRAGRHTTAVPRPAVPAGYALEDAKTLVKDYARALSAAFHESGVCYFGSFYLSTASRHRPATWAQWEEQRRELNTWRREPRVSVPFLERLGAKVKITHRSPGGVEESWVHEGRPLRELASVELFDDYSAEPPRADEPPVAYCRRSVLAKVARYAHMAEAEFADVDPIFQDHAYLKGKAFGLAMVREMAAVLADRVDRDFTPLIPKPEPPKAPEPRPSLFWGFVVFWGAPMAVVAAIFYYLGRAG